MHFYLMPWIHDTSEVGTGRTNTRGFWRLAERTSFHKDMRSLTQMAMPGPITEVHHAIAAYPTQLPVLPADAEYLGDNLTIAQPQGIRRGIATTLRLPPNALNGGASLWDIFKTLFIELADPTGQAGWKPRRGTPDHGFGITWGDAIRVEPFGPAHRAWAPTIAVWQADYRRNRTAVDRGDLPLEALQRFTGASMRKYRATEDDLLPPEHRGDGSLQPRTKFEDTMTDDDATLLENHTPTGADPGTGWSSLSDSMAIQSNKCEANTSNAECEYILDDEVDTDDHFVEAELESNLTSINHDVMVIGRKHSTLATRDFYVAGIQVEPSAGDHMELWKVVAGVETEIGDSGDGEFVFVANTQYLTKLEFNANDDIKVYRDDVEKISVNNDDITGNVKGGLRLDDDTSARGKADDFVIEDLAVLDDMPREQHVDAVGRLIVVRAY